MEYLGAAQGRNREDALLIRELGRRLESLRFYDQYFGDADWLPQTATQRDGVGSEVQR
jgi:hypothetical protein